MDGTMAQQLAERANNKAARRIPDGERPTATLDQPSQALQLSFVRGCILSGLLCHPALGRCLNFLLPGLPT